MADVTKAVIPAAGLGTRFLPATKATPKEMLPVVDKPAIQYVVEEAVAAGLDDVLLITGRSKRSIEDHFDRAYELEEALAAKEEYRTAGPGARVQRAGHRALRAPGRPQGARSRRALRGPARGRRAVRGAARRRPHRQPRPAADPDDRGARALRRQRGGADGGRPGAGLAVRLRGHHADRRGGRGHGHRPGGEAGARLGAEQLDPDRPLRLRPGDLRACCGTPRPAGAGRSSSPTRC